MRAGQGGGAVMSPARGMRPKYTRPWREVFSIATPEQLACFGVQRPGDPFWTETTLARAQVRYPEWDLSPYRAAMARS